MAPISKSGRELFINSLYVAIAVICAGALGKAAEFTFKKLGISGESWLYLIYLVVTVIVLLYLINSIKNVDASNQRRKLKKVNKNKTFNLFAALLIISFIFGVVSYFLVIVYPVQQVNKFSELNSWVGNTTTMQSATLNFSSESSILRDNFIFLGKNLHLVGAANYYSNDTENQNVTLYLIVNQINKILFNESLCEIHDNNSVELIGIPQHVSSSAISLSVNIEEDLTLPEGGWEISVCTISHKNNRTNENKLILTRHVEVISVKDAASIFYSQENIRFAIYAVYIAILAILVTALSFTLNKYHA
jgi:hypothetical protein